jgi:hypothetical protein
MVIAMVIAWRFESPASEMVSFLLYGDCDGDRYGDLFSDRYCDCLGS